MVLLDIKAISHFRYLFRTHDVNLVDDVFNFSSSDGVILKQC